MFKRAELKPVVTRLAVAVLVACGGLAPVAGASRADVSPLLLAPAQPESKALVNPPTADSARKVNGSFTAQCPSQAAWRIAPARAGALRLS